MTNITVRQLVLSFFAICIYATMTVANATAAQTVLRVVPHADLKILDPGWTTIYITRNHGYLIYDTLFAMDDAFEVHPQMVDKWTVSDDQLTWTFTLRSGLKWHDGQDVTGEDCIASLKRWGKRDGMGQLLFSHVDEMVTQDPKTFSIKLKAPYPLMLESLGKLSSFVPFMMPKRVAETDPYQKITEYIGSGPFIFKQDEFVPGKKVVYLKNPNYVPREEPVSGAAGGKIAKVDRIEWISYAKPKKAINALLAGKVDYLEAPAPRWLRKLKKNKNTIVGLTDPAGFIGMARFNQTIPPFDNPKVRQAVLTVMNQRHYMKAAIVNKEYWKECHSVFPCDSPLAQEDKNSPLKKAQIKRAKRLLREAKYDGKPVVILDATDIATIANFTKVTAAKLRSIGMKVDVQKTDWATLTTRRASREPVDKGGWNMFHTFWAAPDMYDPTRIVFSGDPEKGWFGWPNDPELEKLRQAYTASSELKEKVVIAKKVQDRIFSTAAFAPLGQFYLPVAYRKNVKGLVRSPVQFYWNIEIDEKK